MCRLPRFTILFVCFLGCSASSAPEEASPKLSPSERERPSSKGTLETARIVQEKGLDGENGTFWPGMILLNDNNYPEIHIPPKRCGRDAVPTLIGFLEKSKDAGIRRCAAMWLGDIGPDASEAIPTLKKALKDPSPKVRVEAARSIHCIEGKKELSEEPFIPEAASIEKMTIEVYDHPLPPFPDIGPFEVPREHYDKILDFFRHPAQRDDIASKVDNQELGTARLLLPGRRSVRLCWFYIGNDPHFSFSCAGVRYRTTGAKFTKDQAVALDTMIREIYKRAR